MYAWGGTHENLHSVENINNSYQNSSSHRHHHLKNNANYGGYRLNDADSLVASNTRLY